jgi:hypothetical protein
MRYLSYSATCVVLIRNGKRILEFRILESEVLPFLEHQACTFKAVLRVSSISNILGPKQCIAFIIAAIIGELLV